ncbi:MAG: hypothetical protein ACOH1Y_04135 [Propionicimonas sp.]
MTDALSAIGEVAVALPVELARRTRTDRPTDVYYVSSDEAVPGLPGGSICVISGLAGSGFVDKVREAAKTGDAASVVQLLNSVEEELRTRRPLRQRRRRRDISAAIAGIPAITQVSYRGKLVAEAIPATEELPALRVLVPFAGGSLDLEAFTASTYRLREHAKTAVDTIVVVREPELSTLERKVLERLPAEINQMAIGRGDLVANLGLAAAGLIFVAVVVGGVLLAEYAQRQMQQDRQAQQQQMERDVAGADQQQAQDQGDQAQAQDQGDQAAGDDDNHNNGGRLGQWYDLDKLAVLLEQLDTAAAVTELVELRTALMQAGQVR